MPHLDNATERELLALLSPRLQREADRQELLARALGNDCPALGRIDCRGAAEPFVLRMVAELAHFGEIEPGTQALWKLLKTQRQRVGTDLQARIDALEPIINRPSETASVLPAVSNAAATTAPMHLRIFLASPGDVTHERGLALGVLEQIPYDPSLRGRVTIEAVAWDKPGAGTPMLATMTPQAAIAAGLPKPSQCDIVVVMLWSRMGTPLPPEYCKPDGSAYLSGTQWEYLDALDAARQCGRPEILVYRRSEKCLLDPDDAQFDEKLRQRRNVEAFFATFRNPDGSIRSGFNEYAAPEAFGRQLDLHLRTVINRLLRTRSAPAPSTAGSSAAPTALHPPALWQGSPFPGLRAFTPDDAPIYFGRGLEADELVVRLAGGCRFLAVVGSSGSGKSSLVAAGLLPMLKDNAIEGAKDWLLPRVVPAGAGERKQWIGLRFTPGELGDDPFVALAAKLAPLVPDEAPPGTLARQLADDPAALARYADQILAGSPAWAEALIFIDQFEELLTVVAERHRTPFVDLLATAASTPRLRLVATMRSDFYPRWLEWPRLPEVLRAAPSPVVAPGLGALFEMITGPAARAGLDLEDGLPARILEDTGTDSGALALLAFALHELYEARTGDRRLTQTAYNGFGGVKGAISRRAETTFERLPPGAKLLLHDVFRDLVEADERGVATRRRVPRSRFIAMAEAMALIDAFTDARLLVTDRGPADEAVVEVAHEALFREWPRLRDWIAESADALHVQREIERAAQAWAVHGEAYRWPDERVIREAAPALRRLASRFSLSEPERRFLGPLEADEMLALLLDPATSHAERATIGDRLALLPGGDPRPGVGLRPDGLPDIVWHAIPAGEVELDTQATGLRSRLRGRQRCPVETFHMARHPVTVAQWRAFVDAEDGYDARVRRPRGWEPDPQRGRDNHPAVMVTWIEALAYCEWLGTRFGHEVGLPTEWQWQQAATGGDQANEYPCGPWHDGRANTFESALGRVTAVGLYPEGVSAQGVLDMAGNVWEWCLNKFDAPKDATPGGDARRVVRGGSWLGGRGFARCAYRFDDAPAIRYYYIGFRLVCVAPIS